MFDPSTHPQPTGPVESLRHVLDVYADQSDDGQAIAATRNLYGDGIVTGLTFGDLRALAEQLDGDKCKHCGETIIHLNKLQVGKDMSGWYLEYGNDECPANHYNQHEPA